MIIIIISIIIIIVEFLSTLCWVGKEQLQKLNLLQDRSLGVSEKHAQTQCAGK